MVIYLDKNGNKISRKEYLRREKLKKRFEKKRKAGFERYVKKIRREKAKREALEKKKKEKEKEKKRLAKEKLKKVKKKKVGRPKKTGPKINFYKRRKKKLEKLNRVPVSRKLPPFIYKIISCRNGKQRKVIGKYRTSEDAFEALELLKNEDTNIIFPIEFKGSEVLDNSLDEYLLLEKSDGENIYMRNEYGKLIEQKTNVAGWRILDKHRFKREESFWVYGYDKVRDRKTFKWIYENMILEGLENYYIYRRILIFRNKVILKNDDGTIDLIFCKHPGDAVRFYNLVETWIKRDKIKQILFMGDYSERSEKRRNLENEIMELTGWSRKKVNMNGTTYYLINKEK